MIRTILVIMALSGEVLQDGLYHILCIIVLVFSYGPNYSHTSTIQYIAMYLKETRDEGRIMTPSMVDNLQFNVYTDADLEELFDSKDKIDPIDMKY